MRRTFGTSGAKPSKHLNETNLRPHWRIIMHTWSEVTVVWKHWWKVELVTAHVTRCQSQHAQRCEEVFICLSAFVCCTLRITVQSRLKAPIVTPKELKKFGKLDTNNIFTKETIHFHFLSKLRGTYRSGSHLVSLFCVQGCRQPAGP